MNATSVGSSCCGRTACRCSKPTPRATSLHAASRITRPSLPLATSTRSPVVAPVVPRHPAGSEHQALGLQARRALSRADENQRTFPPLCDDLASTWPGSHKNLSPSIDSNHMSKCYSSRRDRSKENISAGEPAAVTAARELGRSEVGTSASSRWTKRVDRSRKLRPLRLHMDDTSTAPDKNSTVSTISTAYQCDDSEPSCGSRSPTGSITPDSRSVFPYSEKTIQWLDDGVKIYDLFVWDNVIQEDGDGGKVVICRRRVADSADNFNFVMKIRSKVYLRESDLEDEFRKVQVRMLNLAPHPGVMLLEEVWEDDQHYYTLMQRAVHGSLLESLLHDFGDGCVPASVITKVMKEILQAVGHVHKQGILHRDLKPDNIVVHTCVDLSRQLGKNIKKLMLIDFDLAETGFRTQSTLIWKDEVVGTHRFSAPETFVGEFSRRSDLYSVGVILYLLMTGKMPYPNEIFQGITDGVQQGELLWQSRREVGLNMRAAVVDWECDPWPDQLACKELCMKLLAVAPHQRPRSAEDALAHLWFRNSFD